MISIYDSNLRLGIHKFPGIFLSFEKLSSKFLAAAGLAKIGDLKTNNADITKKHNIFVSFGNIQCIISSQLFMSRIGLAIR